MIRQLVRILRRRLNHELEPFRGRAEAVESVRQSCEEYGKEYP